MTKNKDPFKRPKEGDTEICCGVCGTQVKFLMDEKGQILTKKANRKNRTTIPRHYYHALSFDPDTYGAVHWLCRGSGQPKVTYVYQPTKWDQNGKGYRFEFKPVGWKPTK